MIVVAILSILASVIFPRFDLVLQRAHQSKTRSGLGSLRTAISLYYTNMEGVYPLSRYSEGNTHYSADGLSLTTVLQAQIEHIFIPKLDDHIVGFNGFASLQYDQEASNLMKLSPPNDVYIYWGQQDYTPLLNSPFAYDNKTGTVYIANGNYDLSGKSFYTW